VQWERVQAQRRKLQNQMLLCTARSPPRSASKAHTRALPFDEAGYVTGQRGQAAVPAMKPPQKWGMRQQFKVNGFCLWQQQ
jgi:hypothetical protein